MGKKGKIHITSQPSGASVYVDDKAAGVTPKTVDVEPGRHSVEVRLDGHHAPAQTAPVGKGGQSRLAFTLRPVTDAKPPAAIQEPARPTPPPAPTPAESDIRIAHEEAVNLATNADLTALTADPLPADATAESLWSMVREARDIFRSASNRLEQSALDLAVEQEGLTRSATELAERELALAGKQTELDARSDEVTTQEANLKADRERVDGALRDLDERQSAYLKSDTDLRARELNAEAGFNKQRQAMLAQLERSAAALRKTLEATEQRIAERQLAWHEEEPRARERLEAEYAKRQELVEAEYSARRDRLEAEFVERSMALDERDAELAGATRALAADQRRVHFDEADIKEERAQLEQRVHERVAAVQEQFQHRLNSLSAQLSQARADRELVDADLRARQDADRKFGQRSPQQVLKELETLRTDRDGLAAKLAERPDEAATARLAELQNEQEGWHSERVTLHREVAELKRRLAYYGADSGEREVQRDVIQSLHSQRQLLHESHRQIRAEIDGLLSRVDAKVPFPSCSAMDANPDLQAEQPMLDRIGDLGTFVADLQHRIACDPDHPERRLYYTEEDLRSFLAGLAMTPLLLLQGISGTGKTSLPVAFARAMGTKATVIEVQAGWRDPADLVGHYNAFDKRFYEEEFLQALYRAQTPRWRDGVHIVLLDEMNLSHPEQYFSGLLSALPLAPELRRLKLVEWPIEPVPALFVEGRKLPIPPNVWFVGTANHDETTKDFADKTYDRSHVMQFPEAPRRFDATPPEPRPPVSFTALTAAFDTAIRKHEKAARKSIDFLNDNLRAPLKQHFELGWGPRLETQMLRYVPIVTAAGGTLGEATDHILATRLLRKLRHRHDNRPEHLEDLRQRIKEAWPALEKKSGPRLSERVLVAELKRLGRAPEESA